jgi:hypothetical protein
MSSAAALRSPHFSALSNFSHLSATGEPLVRGRWLSRSNGSGAHASCGGGGWSAPAASSSKSAPARWRV